MKRAALIAYLTAFHVLVGIVACTISAHAQNAPPRMAASQVTLSTTAAITAIARSNRAAVTIQNMSAINIYCGPNNGVTSGNGFRVPGVDGSSVTIPTSAAVWCIAASGTPVVSVLEAY